ncbi:hypothetical protein LTR17_004636 [Elasticomyces elasticus]|nr:hypothetical protein LTR17_004636 [Elasticomyces elasticus]
MPPPSTVDRFPHCDPSDTLIDVVVGEGDAQKTFKAYKGVLSFYSSFFDAALNGQFLEAREGIIKLPTESPAIVEMFVHWANTRRFCEDGKDPTEVISYDTLAQLWVFGDAHEIPLCQNAVCDAFALKLYQAKDLPMRRVAGLATETVDYIIMNSPPHQASLQEMLSDALWISYNSIKWADDMKLDVYWQHRNTQLASSEQVARVPEQLGYQIWLNGSWAHSFDRQACRWHVHSGGDSCPA